MTSLSDARFNNISWPSLYSPVVDLGFTGPPVIPGGYYLSDPDDVFKFTLYWTLILHLPFNFIAGIYASFNFLFPPARPTGSTVDLSSPLLSHSALPPEWTKPPRVNARRSRLTFALLVLLAFLGFSLLRAVVGAAVLSFVLLGVYRSGGFYMSTWIPFLWATIQSLIALLGIWPSIIDII